MIDDHQLIGGGAFTAPVFPLPKTVLFPHALLPLHIFEKRYKVMLNDVVEQELPLIIALILENQMTNPPALDTIAGVGEVVVHKPGESGGFDILVRGIIRTRILDELETDTPYRQVRAEPIVEIITDTSKLEMLIQGIRGSVYALVREQPKVGASLVRMLQRETEPAAIADLLSSVVFPEIAMRRRLLAEPHVGKRLTIVRGRLAEILARSHVLEDVEFD